jgi:hypothetical protein
VESRKSIASGDALRVVGVGVCCVLAAVAPFYAGASVAAIFAVAPLTLAIWLVIRSEWSSRARFATVLAVLVVTVALFFALLALALRLHNYN